MFLIKVCKESEAEADENVDYCLVPQNLYRQLILIRESKDPDPPKVKGNLVESQSSDKERVEEV